MNSRLGTSLILALSVLLCCGATSGGCNNEPIGPSKGEVVGATVAAVAVVAVTAVVLVEVSHGHHTLKGCVFNGANGLELRTDDNKTYALSGTTANIAPGNTVRLHGDHKKTPKGTVADPQFVIEKIQKNYGPCQALASPQVASAPRH